MSTINLVIGEKYYNKDPKSSELGGKIISGSIQLLDELGFENFTFKKLAEHIDSTEASVYRYFDNKLKLLVYLTTSYWAWIEYLIDVKTHHLSDPEQQLKTILRVVCNIHNPVPSIELAGIDMSALRRVVAIESDKTYLTKQVDEINNQGLFKGYKRLCHKIAVVVSSINSKYKYPHALISMILEASHQQGYFAQHLPSLTEISVDNQDSLDQQVCDFLEATVLKQIS